jgi:hypothetical protein
MLSKYFKRHFSVFGRLKEYMKSTDSFYKISNNVSPDDIKVQYEEIQKIFEKKQKKNEIVG